LLLCSRYGMEEEAASETPVYLYQSALYPTPTDRRPDISAMLRRKCVRWVSSVGIATRYCLDAISMYLSRPTLYSTYGVSFPVVKWPGRGVEHPPQSDAEVRERVELYLYSTASLGLHGQILTLHSPNSAS
jgi:hypothetical protein